MNNLFLVGMMGSWKSTVGRKLAKTLRKDFIDLDDTIEEVTKMKISDIFLEFGEHRFRAMEEAFFVEKAKQKDQVFSTGGGIVISSNNRKILKNNGVTFFLQASMDTLAKRIHNTTKRPLLTGYTDLQNRLETIWKDRNKYYYDVAHHTILTDELEPLDVLNSIIKLLEIPFENN